QTGLLSSETDTVDDDDCSAYDERLIEPMTWSALAYSGFMWWASAGERDATRAEEADQDRQLLGDLSGMLPMKPQARDEGTDALDQSWYGGATPHTALIAYFHRITSLIFRMLADLDDTADDEEASDDGAGECVLKVTSEDISRMGLDVWSVA